MDSVFLQIGVVTILSAVLGVVARLLHQPIISAYIVAGILLGAGGFAVIPNPELTTDIATIGIIFLLFLVGLELDIGKLRELGTVVLWTGLVQMFVITGLGFIVSYGLGYPPEVGIYLGAAAAFSSTAVVIKRIADRSDLASLYAKMAIGILLLQDVIAILILMFINSGSGGWTWEVAGLFAVKSTGLLLGTWLVTRYVLAPGFFFIAKSSELLFLTSIAYAFLFAFIADNLGFSKEIGAFLAGLSLATLPYNLEIIGKVKPLKDFFLVIFFVVLGLEISPPVILHHWPLIATLSVLVVFGKSFLTSAAIVWRGYPKRPAYLTGASLGQMSEFSLLIVLLGHAAGQVPTEIVGVTAALLVITVLLNTYWNGLNRVIYPILVKPLAWFNGNNRHKELRYRPKKLTDHTLMFGANRMGYSMLRTLEELKHQVLVVDHNPEVIRRLQRRGVPSVYGDIDDYELLRDMGLAAARMVISTVPNLSANLFLVEQTKRANPHSLLIVTAEQISDALELYEAGADYVIVPHVLGGEQAANFLRQVGHRETTSQRIRAERSGHIRHLRHRHRDLVG